MKDGRYHLQKWMWWTKGECVVEVLKTGHFPTTAMVKMPNDKEIEITHISLYDQTVEGIRYKSLPVFSVQYHPEAAPGPNDSKYLFDEFFEMMKK